MNISSASQTSFLSASSASNFNSSAILRVGQSQIENRGSVIQPVDESTPANGLIDSSPRTITVVSDNSNASNSGPQAAVNAEQREQIQNQDQQNRQQDAQQETLEQQQVQELVARDREVRNHERAHAAVGGQYAGSPRYTFERGPDGINYAVGGEVSISTAPVSGDPEATIQKAQIIRRAALAPTEPSAQDRSVAAQAVQLEAAARVELQNLQAQERIDERDALEARVQQRTDGLFSPAGGIGVNVNDTSANISNPDVRQNNSTEILVEDIESNVQRLSDELNLRISQIDSFGVPEPGQVFNQFI